MILARTTIPLAMKKEQWPFYTSVTWNKANQIKYFVQGQLSTSRCLWISQMNLDYLQLKKKHEEAFV